MNRGTRKGASTIKEISPLGNDDVYYYDTLIISFISITAFDLACLLYRNLLVFKFR